MSWLSNVTEYLSRAEKARARRRRRRAQFGPAESSTTRTPPANGQDGERHDGPAPRRPAARAVRATTKPAASGKRAATKPSTRLERPLWQRAAPPGLTDQEYDTWENARRHLDPESDVYERDPEVRAQWLAHLERLVAVAARRRERRRAGRP